MPIDSAAPSPAAQTNSDAQKTTTAANVSQAEAIARFVKADEARAKANQTADTKATVAPPATESSTESPSAAEPAQTDSPEAESPAESESSEAPEATTTTEDGTNPEAKADDVLSPESQTLDLDPKARKILDDHFKSTEKRIHKEVGKRKALEVQLEQVKQQLTALTTQQTAPQAAPAPAPIANAPLPDIKDPAALVEYRNTAKSTVRWAEEVLDRDDIDQGVQVGDKTYTKAEIKAIMRNARVALEDKIPAQQEYFQQRAQEDNKRQQVYKAAVEKMPFLAEQNNPEVVQTVNYLKASNPAILASPDAAWNVGLMILGARALQAQNKPEDASAKTAEKPKVVAAAPKPKPPGDQTAVSTTAQAPRKAPGITNGSVARPQGNASANQAAEYLARMDAARAAARR